MKTPAIQAGATYFAIVFAAGFAFGTARAVLVGDAPQMRLMAVAIELPLILAVSWFACGYVVRRFAVPGTVSARATMGATAFVLLLAGEVAISVGLVGRTLGEHFALYGEASHALGLAGQIVFTLLPLARIRCLRGFVGRK